MKFFILDEREIWHEAAIEAAASHGHEGERIFGGAQTRRPGIGFIRPHADPIALERNKVDFEIMASRVLMIQDRTQVELYEDKSGQFKRWADWMPDTWRFTEREAALAFLEMASYPLVSKADVGASSVNVRILKDADAARRHVAQIFGPGIQVHHGASCPKSLQKDYVLLQRFIPHQVTWRVNAIGDSRAIFKRFCYPNRPVAQTGNVEPVLEMTAECESLLDYSNRFFQCAQTKWCAIDILRDGAEWKLLETSLAWPWPSPGRCMEAPLFGSGRVWAEMFEVMFDQLEVGAWQA